jgi:hypothetical protein
MSVQQLKVDAIGAAQKYKARYKETLDPDDLDMFQRFMDVYNHLAGVGSVTSIIAGDNITISPAGGTGDVTINAAGVGFFSQIQNGPTITFASGETSIKGTGVGSLSVPANYFIVGNTFKFFVHGDMSSANNSQLLIKIKEGALTIAQTTITLVATTNEHFDMELTFIVRAVGAAGVAKLLTVGTFSYSKSSNNLSEVFHFDSLEEANFDTTIATTLDVTAQWLTPGATNQLFTQSLNLYKIW